ncbi:metallophosphoesterase family protein [Sporosarcina sp. CAU 1771]
MIRFIHAADLHLDSPFKGMVGMPAHRLTSLRESTFTAFTNLIQHAMDTKPDFVLIVGDIYDGEDRSLRAQMKFHEGMKKLDAQGIPVFISHGNHDHLGGSWTRFELPSNVHVFDKEVERATLTVRGHEVSIHGFSYNERHVRESMIHQYPAVENNEGFHIGMLHGSPDGDLSHAVYAPFTKGELLSKNYHYWALGHIHLRQNLHEQPLIVYPGNTQGRHRNERGIKGFYDVELLKTGTNLNFIPTSAIVFEEILISVKGIQHANEWLVVCKEAINTYKMEYGAGIVELVMTDIDSDFIELFNQSLVEEWLDVLRDTVEESEPFVWIQKIKLANPKNVSGATGTITRSVEETIEKWTVDDWKDVLKDVYQHVQGSKYLDVLTEQTIDEIKKGAVSLLTTQTSKMK